MTSPGGMNSGFDSGDDFIAARVTIDVPTEGIAGLREITQEMDRFRTGVEAANRSSETFAGYLQRIAEAANQAASATENMISMLERTTDYQNRAATSGVGGPMPQLNASPQYSDPFQGASLGMGGMGGYGGYGGDMRSQLDALRDQNPRAYVNKMAASGQYRMGDIPATSPSGQDIQTAADRINQRTQMQYEGQVDPNGNSNIGSRAGRGGINQQVQDEMGGGGLGTGMRAFGTLAGMLPQGMGGALGTAARVAGPVGAVIGGGLLANEAVQRAGGIYQDYKNMGSVRGGGAAEGVGYEIGIRALALNPFISGDQSRQIIQQGLREGYTGKEFDTVTSMVASNLKDMNMDISQSFALLRKNVKEGGMTGVGLSSALDEIKILSQSGSRSLPELIAGYQQTSGNLINSGMGGAAASQAALVAGGAMSGAQVGKDSGEQLVSSMASNPLSLARLKYQGGLNVPAGLMPQAMPAMFDTDEEGGAFAQASEEVIRKWAMKYFNAAGKPEEGTVAWANAWAKWQMYLQQQGVPWANDAQTALEWFRKLTTGRSPMNEGKEKSDAAAGEVTKTEGRNYLSRVGGRAASSAAAVGNTFGSMIGSIGGTIADVFTDNTDNIDDRWKNWYNKANDRGAAADARGKGYKSKALDNIQGEYGASGYEIVKDGQAVKFDQGNKEQMEQLSSGDLRWRPKGQSGGGYTLAETKGLAGDDLRKAMEGKPSRVSGEVQIGLTDEAKRLLKPTRTSIPLTAHEQQSNAGVGTATPNNALPGEGPRR
jgi:hypothetical protein